MGKTHFMDENGASHQTERGATIRLEVESDTSVGDLTVIGCVTERNAVEIATALSDGLRAHLPNSTVSATVHKEVTTLVRAPWKTAVTGTRSVDEAAAILKRHRLSRGQEHEDGVTVACTCGVVKTGRDHEDVNDRAARHLAAMLADAGVL